MTDTDGLEGFEVPCGRRQGADAAEATASRSLQPHLVDTSEMLDKFTLQQLAWTYCHAIDRRDLMLVRSLYHDDAVDGNSGPVW